MLLQFRKKLTKKNVLDEVKDRVIYEFYLKEALIEGKRYNAPYRDDPDPSVTFKYFPNSDSWVWRDWGDGGQSRPSSVFDFVCKIYNCGFFESLIHINKDLSIGLESLEKPSNESKSFSGYNIPKENRVRKKKVIQVKFREFEKRDCNYWNSYGISKNTLDLYKVKPVKYAWVNKALVKQDSKSAKIYAYMINDKVKIYHPLSSRRFLGDVTKDEVSGYEQLPDSGGCLIITKSHKDVMVLYEMGYNAISPQSENDYMDDLLMEELSLRFKTIYLLFDNDKPGMDASDKFIEKFDYVNQIFIDKNLSKDISDLAKIIGIKDAKKIIEKLLWKC